MVAGGRIARSCARCTPSVGPNPKSETSSNPVLFGPTHPRKPSPSLLTLAAIICLLAGCSQAKYRMQADKEVKYLVEQKSNDPRWDFPDYTIGMDPRARYFDPTDPDG